MNEREKLIKVLKTFYVGYTDGYVFSLTDKESEYFADYLIQNGIGFVSKDKEE